MFDFFRSLFKPSPPSGATAKERLRLVLLSDHLSLAPDVIEAMKRDLLDVLSRYVEIDTSHADVTFEHRDNEIAMLASVPITAVRDRPLPVAPAPPAAQSIAPETPVVAEAPPDETPRAETPADEAVAESAPSPVAGPSSEEDVLAPARSANARPPRRRRRRKNANAGGTQPKLAPPPGGMAAQA